MNDNTIKKSSISNVPKQVKMIVQGLYALVILHLVVPFAMWGKLQTLATDALKVNPKLSPNEVDAIVCVTLISAAIFHIIFVIAYVWLSIMIYKRKNWLRIVLTTILIVATLASAVSFKTSTMFRAIIPITDLIQLILILLMWIPITSRKYFTARKNCDSK